MGMLKNRLILTAMMLALPLAGLVFFGLLTEHNFNTLPYHTVDGPMEGQTLDAQRVGEFDLVNHLGEPFSSDELRGKVWLAAFYGTDAPHVAQVTRQLLWPNFRYRDEGDIVVVSFSLSPEHDTPEVLQEYVERNTRYPAHKGGNREMLDNLLDGVPLSGWTLRRMLESISTYDAALAKVQSAHFVATEYVVMSGVRRGDIVARDPSKVAHLSTLGPAAAYVIVTNFDYWWHDVREYLDPTGGHLGIPRRVAAQRILNASLNAGLALTPGLMNATISADGVLADTIFQAVADVELGLWAIAQPVLPSS